MKDLTQKILKDIKKGEIVKIPKRHFLVKKILIWSFFIVALVLGGLSLGLIFHHFQDVGFNNTMPYYRNDLPRFVMMTIPYFWLILLILFLLLAYFEFRKTEKGYKYSKSFLITLGIILFFAIGGAIHLIGGSNKIDRGLREHAPMYQRLNPGKEKIWSSPQRWLLAGTVENIEIENEKFMIISLDGKKWLIKMGWLKGKEYINLEFLKIGEKVKILGKEESRDVFDAKVILPWWVEDRRIMERMMMKSGKPRDNMMRGRVGSGSVIINKK